MSKLAQFRIPGSSSSAREVVPAGIPKGGIDTAGKAFLQTGYQYLFIAAIVLAVLFSLFSGIQMMTSGGDPQKVAEAKTRLTFSIIGLIVVILAFIIVSAIIKSVGGSPTNLLK